MKAAYLHDADPSAVSEVVAEVLKERGALVTERSHSHLRFEGLNPGRAYSFSKGGYVGTYRHVGETEVELRVRVEATLPTRLFWGTVVADLAVAALLFVLDPDSSVWVATAAVLYAAFLATLLLYVGTWRSTWAVERELLADTLATLREREDAPSEILTEEELEIRRLEEELEGEITELELRERRKSEPAPPKAPKAARATGGFKLPFGRKAPPPSDESIEAKRARLEALRAEVERRRREADQQQQQPKR